MSKDKVQNSEFEQKLREAAQNPVPESELQVVRSDEPLHETNTIPVIEEQVHIGKKTVETGSVYIYKDVHEDEVTVNLPYTHEEVDIQRVPVNQYATDTPPPVRYEGETMIIPVLKEVLVVEKRVMVVEELHVTKRKIENHDTQQVKLRREELKVDREDYNTRNNA